MCSIGSDKHLGIEALQISIGGFRLQDINLSCNRGEYHILLGPTGAGKSTLMKSILGFHKARGGRILLGEREITGALPERRGMGYLPQNFLLFHHLNVEANVRFGFGAKGTDRAEADALTDRLCRILNIEHLRQRHVRFLSGGEKQRVALGRALASQPELILLDEPFSSIDEGAKRVLWFELKKVIREVGVTAIHITHNLEEAYTMGDRLSVLIGGRLVQTGTNEEIFKWPASESVARYLNYRNIFSGVATPDGQGCSVDLGSFRIKLARQMAEGAKVTICLRPQDIKILRKDKAVKGSLSQNILSGEIVALFPLPESCLIWFRVAGSRREYDLELKVPAYIPVRHGLHPGRNVQVGVWEPNVIVF